MGLLRHAYPSQVDYGRNAQELSTILSNLSLQRWPREGAIGGKFDHLRMRVAMFCARASVGIEERTKYAGIPSAML